MIIDKLNAAHLITEAVAASAHCSEKREGAGSAEIKDVPPRRCAPRLSAPYSRPRREKEREKKKCTAIYVLTVVFLLGF